MPDHWNKRFMLIVTILLVVSLLLTACGERNLEAANADSSERETLETNTSEQDEMEQSPPVEQEVVEEEPFVAELLGEIPEKDISLYSRESEGVVLHVRDAEQVFLWEYMTPRRIMPILEVYDYDGDGVEELSAILYIGSGTGVSVQDLHIVEINNTKQSLFIDHFFEPEDYLAQIDDTVKFKTITQAGELFGELTLGSHIDLINLETFQSIENGKITNRLAYGSIISFYSEQGKLMLNFKIGITKENSVMPEYFGSITADINYRAGSFTLVNFKFEQDPS
ncbi:MAG: hypothetical protein P0Y55_06780 [Candidatus Cohnella colombiensis]|uniref:Uncharacterized protein n=1 Tax=Candidatus Cohnella colombiensis TaxID=3121368 RepID=A0AA95EZJ4_9BACL|nr:MAG: hypothetical protein P0Y55_06780 [Cohnella sp.]